jgi:hypothetical protein
MKMAARYTAAIIFAISVLAAGTASAESVAECSVLEIRASEAEGGIDPELKALEKRLKKGAFRQWTRYQFKGKHDRKLVLRTAQEIRLNGGGKVSLLFLNRIDRKGRKPQLSMSWQLDGKSGKRLGSWKRVFDAGSYALDAVTMKSGNGVVFAVRCMLK